MNGHIESIRMRGRLAFPDAPELAVRIECDQFDPWEIALQITATGGRDGARLTEAKLQLATHEPVTIESLDDPAQNVTIVSLSQLSFTPPVSIDLQPDEIWVGINRAREATPDQMDVKIDLTPSGILAPFKIVSSNYTGSVAVEKVEPGEVTVTGPLSTWHAAEHYEYFDTMLSENRVRNQIQRAVLAGKIEIPQDSTLVDVHKRVAEEVHSICLALSLAYRRPVHAYKFEYIGQLTSDQQASVATARIRMRPNRRREYGDELIAYRGLCASRLDSLHRNLVEHPRYADLGRAISFIAASNVTTMLEDSYFLAFSALDLLVQVLDTPDADAPTQAQWRRIKKAVQRALEAACAEENPVIEPGPMVQKIGELRRPPSMGRILRAVARAGIVVDDLWPKQGFEAGISRAIGSRNELFHSAQTVEPGAMAADKYRLIALFERLVVSELRFPTAHLSILHDQTLKRINSGGED